MNPLILAIGTLSLCPPATPQESPFLDGRVQIEGRDYGYRLLPPRQLVEGERYPLVLFLHGAGERGDDNQAQLRHFPVRMAAEEYRDRFPCFVLAPQCPEGAVWADGGRGLAQGGTTKAEPQPAMRAAIAAFEEVLGAHPIDRERIYLTGLSMGGAGTWDLAARHPEWFAAAVPICGGGDVRQAARLATRAARPAAGLQHRGGGGTMETAGGGKGRRIVAPEFKDFEPELGGERRRVYENHDREGMHINWSASGWK